MNPLLFTGGGTVNLMFSSETLDSGVSGLSGLLTSPNGSPFSRPIMPSSVDVLQSECKPLLRVRSELSTPAPDTAPPAASAHRCSLKAGKLTRHNHLALVLEAFSLANVCAAEAS